MRVQEETEDKERQQGKKVGPVMLLWEERLDGQADNGLVQPLLEDMICPGTAATISASHLTECWRFFLSLRKAEKHEIKRYAQGISR